MATMEEAKRCPKCDQPGVEITVKPAAERYQGKVHIIECQNTVCKWFEQRWMVQVKPDGTIPDARSQFDRPGGGAFPQMSEGQQAAARAGIEQIQEEERRSRESPLSKGE